VVGLYVDDLVIAGIEAFKSRFKNLFNQRFKVQDNGVMTDILGLKVVQQEGSNGQRVIHISVPGHIQSLPDSYISYTNHAKSPMDPKSDLKRVHFVLSMNPRLI
jgi:hypothetical protein